MPAQSAASLKKQLKEMTADRDQQFANHIRMDQLADKRAQEIERKDEQIADLQKTLQRTQRNLARALGYIDRVNDMEPEEVSVTPHHPINPAIREKGPFQDRGSFF